MAAVRELLDRVREGFSHAVVAFVDDDGSPISVATDHRVDPERGTIQLEPVAPEVTPPGDREVNVVFSHIRPREGVGYDERRYVSLWGRISPAPPGGRMEFVPRSGRFWDEHDVPFFQYSELGVPRARAYLEDLSARTGRPVRPRLAAGWLFLRATRLPFLTATAVPVLLGTAAAALEGPFELWLAVLALVGASAVHLGLNVSNDVFDTLSGADPANTTPTQFSGGSRVIQYGLLSLRQMALLAAGFYAVGIGIGLYLAATRGFWPLFGIGAAGVAISVAYTAPPLRLVHRGVGEIAVGLGFGPIMVLGAYYVQAQRFSGEALFLSIPVAILIALVLYVNEVPDRAGDAAAGKGTLPVRLSRETVVAGYAWATGIAYALVAAGAVAGVIPRPAILALATIPMALSVWRGLRESYESPYALMPTMGKGVAIHLFTGLLLFAGYLIAILSDRNLDSVPFFLR